MPLYDYKCPHCQEEFEEFRSIAERETAPCPKCKKDAQKILSSFFTTGGSGDRGGNCGFTFGGG